MIINVLYDNILYFSDRKICILKYLDKVGHHIFIWGRPLTVLSCQGECETASLGHRAGALTQQTAGSYGRSVTVR